ncbi:MAG: hypothetical protein EOO15_15135 [Chitinophagaceae bacterium]|nr:MAG: hypothetical protein EOO15_15135 [Chitinophagaceae bacterium]
MKYLLLSFFLAASCATSAQTHELLRKSIGGNVELPEAAGADFGLPSDYDVIIKHVDSLIYMGNGVAVKVTGHYRKYQLRSARMPLPQYKNVDTLYGHPLFSRQHALDSIRAVLRKEQVEGLGETKYVGYDSTRAVVKPVSKARRKSAPIIKASKRAEVLAVAVANANDEPPGPGPLFVGGTALFALLLCGGIARLYRHAAVLS